MAGPTHDHYKGRGILGLDHRSLLMWSVQYVATLIMPPRRKEACKSCMFTGNCAAELCQKPFDKVNRVQHKKIQTVVTFVPLPLCSVGTIKAGTIIDLC